MTDDASSHERAYLAEKIAAEIVMAEKPGDAIKKWRIFLKIPQKEIAQKMKITQSVISDYESNRRKSPGADMIKRLVTAFLDIDSSRNAAVAAETDAAKQGASGTIVNAILDIKEFTELVSVEKFCAAAGCEIVNKADAKKEIKGYTIIDSVAAITNLPASELSKIYGSNPNRALIFTKVSTGRSPLVAIKVTGIKPGLVMMQGIDKIDDVAVKIADALALPIGITKKSPDDLVKELKKAFG